MSDHTSLPVSAVANEAALRYLASELERVQLLAAQATGNLALERNRNAELQAEIDGLKAPKPRARRSRGK